VLRCCICGTCHIPTAMRFLSDKAKHLDLGWNERGLTETDFYRICRKFKITVEEMPLRVSGFYYRVLGRDFIAIDSRLSGNKRLMVMFHELAHFLFHTPESGETANFHGIDRKSRQEIEADAFALCSVIPEKMLENAAADLDQLFPPELVAERLALYRRSGI